MNTKDLIAELQRDDQNREVEFVAKVEIFHPPSGVSFGETRFNLTIDRITLIPGVTITLVEE